MNLGRQAGGYCGGIVTLIVTVFEMLALPIPVAVITTGNVEELEVVVELPPLLPLPPQDVSVITLIASTKKKMK